MNRIIYHDVMLGRVTTVLTDDIIIFQDKEAVVSTRDHGDILIPIKNIRSIDQTTPKDDAPHAGNLNSEYSADDINMPEGGLP